MNRLHKSMFSWKVTPGRRALYWSLQVLGWGAYFGYLELFIAQSGNRALIFVQWPAVVVSHLLGSHMLRAVIKGRGWTRLPLSHLARRLAAAMFLIDVPVQAVCLVTALLFHVASLHEYGKFAGLYLLAAIVLYSIWSGLYFGFQYSFLYRDTEFERVRLQSSLKEAELQALKSQVNPHFLFNCLNNVRSLVVEDPSRAREMLLRLSELLRHALDAVRNESIPLAEELHVVEAYLELEKLQLENRLQWRIVAPGEAGSAAVPPMLVQQLVENAVKHGISKLPSGGEIVIYAELHEGRLNLRVENTGVLEISNRTGLGIVNARERLALFGGADAHLALQQIGPQLVRAAVQIPLQVS